jgi:hypothetical protein
MVFQELFDAPAQLGIVRAGGVEKSGAVGGRQFKRAEIKSAFARERKGGGVAAHGLPDIMARNGRKVRRKF